ncbi:low temperature responsive protein [Maudiozyma exigua]|uniref:Protein LOT5 n=1 Tax=Maudiozyma exigua TaxID=34358 RepID=A0A9P7BCX7_MAUEX|nr:low temperature responsive protein [Kazachstania exigua]
MNNQRQTCQVIWVKPTIENVIPYMQYKRTQPEGTLGNDYIETSQDLLLGGGRDLIMSLIGSTIPKFENNEKHDNNNIPYNNDSDMVGEDTTTNKERMNSENSLDPVELFILNHCIILWFDGLGHGIQVPYGSVIYHASRRINYRNEGHKLEILLGLERDEVLDQFFPREQQLQPDTDEELDVNEYTMSSVEIILTPKYSMYDRHYSANIETLFTFANFGINRGDDMVNNCNEAMAIALELSNQNDFDSTTEPSEEHSMDIEPQENTVYTGMLDTINGNHNSLHNTGFADDLDSNDITNQGISRDGNDAGMSLEL